MKKEPTFEVHLRLSQKTIDEVDGFCQALRKENRSQGLRELIEIGLFTFANWGQLRKNPEKLEELHEQFKSSQAVEYLQHMGMKEFEVLWSIFENEHKSRYYNGT